MLGFEKTQGKNSQAHGEVKIKPNPDKTDKKPMYLKRPRKLDQKLFKPHNKNLSMPGHLKSRYSKKQ